MNASGYNRSALVWHRSWEQAAQRKFLDRNHSYMMRERAAELDQTIPRALAKDW